MFYRELRFPRPLNALIECAWMLTTDLAEQMPGVPERILPDGCVELVLHCSERFETSAGDGRRLPQPAAFVAGTSTVPLVVFPVTGARTVGIRFRPGCAYPFLGTSLSHLTDRTVDLRDLWGSAAVEFHARIAEADDDAARLGLLVRELGGRLARGGRDAVTAFAVDALIASGGRASVAGVAERANVTTRFLERRFADHVGVSPKALARTLRFQNALRARARSSAGGRTDWARIAVDCGYADQSHLIRDFAAFAGFTPARLSAREGELAGYFTELQRLDALFEGRR